MAAELLNNIITVIGDNLMDKNLNLLNDMDIDNPAYYSGPAYYNGTDVIEIINRYNLGFELGNVIKYILRAKNKGEYLQDIKKAQWYLNWFINNIELKRSE